MPRGKTEDLCRRLERAESQLWTLYLRDIAETAFKKALNQHAASVVKEFRRNLPRIPRTKIRLDLGLKNKRKKIHATK